MIYLVLFTTILFGATSGAATFCSVTIGTDRFERIEAAILGEEMSLDRLIRTKDHLNRELLDLPVLAGRTVLLDGSQDRKFEHLSQFLYLATTARARGWSRTADGCLREFADHLAKATGEPVDFARLAGEVRHLSERRDVQNSAAMLSFMVTNGTSIERAFLEDLIAEPSGSLSFGPIEIEMTKMIMQYGHTNPGLRLLDVGGQGTVGAIVKRYLPDVPSVLLHAERPPVPVRQWATRHDLVLVRGALMKSDVRKDLVKRGAFQVVTALNQINRDVYPRVAPELLARALRSLVREHGLLLILNDAGRPPPFTAEQAVAAGFDVVVWNADRSLSPSTRAALYGAGAPADAGDLRGFVLRVGTEDLKRIPAPSALIQLRR